MGLHKRIVKEAMLIVTYIINRLPTRVLNDISPVEYLLSFVHHSPLVSSLLCQVFGCVGFVYYHDPNRNKLDLELLNVSLLIILQIEKG